MSEKKARVYTNTSRRASRQQSVDRRPVYKSVLGNPFHVDWPTVSPSLQESILLQLITLLDGVAAYYQCARNERKKARLATNSSDQKQDVTPSNSDSESRAQPTSAPPITSHITLGINEVTKALETEIRSSRQVVVTSDTTFDTTQPLTSVIFICHADLDNPAIVAHLPQLIALCNSARHHGHKIKVLLLPAGAESSIARALGYPRRVSVMALDVSAFLHIVVAMGADDTSELDPWTGPVGTSSCHRDRSPGFVVDVYTRGRFGTFSHQATYDNCSKGYESCQRAENARASCGQGEEEDEVSASACRYRFIVIVREH
ncbi:hypothetical protein EI94DRAFT_1747673 [Lactarius quietus]|nr:hypothetical protein EI94DRAFT_1747673 [Lactarius quietus]